MGFCFISHLNTYFAPEFVFWIASPKIYNVFRIAVKILLAILLLRSKWLLVLILRQKLCGMPKQAHWLHFIRFSYKLNWNLPKNFPNSFKCTRVLHNNLSQLYHWRAAVAGMTHSNEDKLIFNAIKIYAIQAVFIKAIYVIRLSVISWFFLFWL